jgi:hypothetical protein
MSTKTERRHVEIDVDRDALFVRDEVLVTIAVKNTDYESNGGALGAIKLALERLTLLQ